MTNCKNCEMTDEYCASECNSQNKKNEQLTEQWKKGELPSGWYYIKGGDGGIYPAENCLNYDSINDRAYSDFYYAEDEIEEIVDKVPRYSEWKASYNCMLENEVLRLKNAQLKELLKECKDIFDECFSPSAKYGELYKEIDEALK